MIMLRVCWCVVFCLSLSVHESAEAAERVASRVPLFENLGTLHHPITTRSQEAQRYFDQGLRLVYGFNHEEAIRAFEEAARLDPAAAMAYWGIALALGPNINAAMDKTDERRAWEALQKARSYSAHVTPAEQAYIQAISKRYSLKGLTRTAQDKAYADAMRVLWKQFPDDADAGVLFAEALMDLHPWDLWTPDGRAKSGTEEIVRTLEAVLARVPNHPGACHYYIHAMEASSTPERALDCAERLPGLMPGAGHLVHMPAHIHMRLGRYHEAAEHNAQAAEIDRSYLARRSSTGDEADGYYRHNLHFLWASLVMEGRSAEAMKVARQLTRTMTEAQIRQDSTREWYLPVPLWSMIRFGQWEALLQELPPLNTFRLTQAIWRLGRGMALIASGKVPGAEGEHAALATLAKRFARNKTAEEQTQRAIIQITERLLAGEIATHHKHYEAASTALREAIKLEDALPYSEPPFWPIPIRQYLGVILQKAGQPHEAESVYRADLIKHPHNGWAQYGLMQSLRAQRKDREANEVEKLWKQAWVHADVNLVASRF
ncbi:MAG: tetratricopeptide repeat protein [Nitrospira sp.]|nr:tetratricopeptide repeat protein [Nitrospira sp.]